MGFHLLVWCPKCTPASSNCFIEITLMSFSSIWFFFHILYRVHDSPTSRPTPVYEGTNRKPVYVFFYNCCILPQISCYCKQNHSFYTFLSNSKTKGKTVAILVRRLQPQSGADFAAIRHRTPAPCRKPLPALRHNISDLFFGRSNRDLIGSDRNPFIVSVPAQEHIKIRRGFHKAHLLCPS